VDNLRDYASAVAQEKGVDSPEAKAAAKNALDAMADIGGYGVTKDGGGYSSYSDIDPITGQFRVNIYGTSTSTPQEPPYSALLAIGKSANPPRKVDKRISVTVRGYLQACLVASPPLRLTTDLETLGCYTEGIAASR